MELIADISFTLLMRGFYLGITLMLAGCAAIDPMKNAPPSSDAPYHDARTEKLTRTIEHPAAPTMLPKAGEKLNLPQLVDLAQSNNRNTKAAWQVARGAAAATGIAAAEYFPLLAVLASYGGGYMDFETSARDNIGGALAATSLVPNAIMPEVDQLTGTGNVVHSGIGTTYKNLLGGAGLRWLLFDFGGRENRNRAAVSDQLAANLRFNATHQKVVFAVTEAYYQLQVAQRRADAAHISKTSAAEVLNAAQAKFDRGLLTDPELKEVNAAHAQANYDAVTASSLVEIARVNLATTAGLPPGLAFRTASTDFDNLARSLEKPLDEHIRLALRNRPDLLAQASAVQAAEARLRVARADRLPSLALDAVATYNRFSPTGNNSQLFNNVTEEFQNYGGFLTVQWPIFLGFAKENTVKMAESAKLAAQEELQLMREQIIADVWKSYVRAKNAIAGRSASLALQSAAKESYSAALAAFDRGVMPVQEVLRARSAFAQSTALVATADAAIAESLTALALSSGSL